MAVAEARKGLGDNIVFTSGNVNPLPVALLIGLFTA